MADSIRLKDAINNPFWLMVWAGEPQREIDVRMTYDDLKKFCESRGPKTGVWAGTVCTACGESTSDYYNCEYCPHCGAKMEDWQEDDKNA